MKQVSPMVGAHYRELTVVQMQTEQRIYHEGHVESLLSSVPAIIRSHAKTK